MPTAHPERRWPATAGRGAAALWLVLALPACDLAPTSAASIGAPYVLTSRGDPVRANAPPGVEVMLGAKQVRPAAKPGGGGLKPSWRGGRGGPPPKPSSHSGVHWAIASRRT